MTIYEAVKQEVTSRQVADLYGLKVDRNGRGYCPWHDDGKHPALKFFANGKCYCHACHMTGDAVTLTAQMLGLDFKDAAWQVYRDFHLNTPINGRPDPETKLKVKRERDKWAAFNKRWGYLCDVVHEADAKLAEYTPETIDGEFDLILRARCDADLQLDLMWEDRKCERA